MGLFYNRIANFSTPEMEIFSERLFFLSITGIICEYNPFHLGHKRQLDCIREENSGIVCLMSGNFVQRGAPAIVDKSLRAKAAILSGADLVLELPVTVSLRSAEGFAQGSVSILSKFCDQLSFGAESGDVSRLMDTASFLLSETFSHSLQKHLEKGLSFPSARQAALDELGLDGSLLQRPNNILAVEYCKAILQQASPMKPSCIQRNGSYHDQTPDENEPSATALRHLLESGSPWQSFVPPETVVCLKNAVLHAIDHGEKAILAKLRTMPDAEFEALPYGSEGLWRKLMHAARQEAALEDILVAAKSKRYTRTRLDRMVMCAFLGINEQSLNAPVPYVRVLAFNDKGREILKTARQAGHFPNVGERQDHPYQLLEDRCGDLYGLFAQTPERPGIEATRRVYYQA